MAAQVQQRMGDWKRRTTCLICPRDTAPGPFRRFASFADDAHSLLRLSELAPVQLNATTAVDVRPAHSFRTTNPKMKLQGGVGPLRLCVGLQRQVQQVQVTKAWRCRRAFFWPPSTYPIPSCHARCILPTSAIPSARAWLRSKTGRRLVNGNDLHERNHVDRSLNPSRARLPTAGSGGACGKMGWDEVKTFQVSPELETLVEIVGNLTPLPTILALPRCPPTPTPTTHLITPLAVQIKTPIKFRMYVQAFSETGKVAVIIPSVTNEPN